MAQGIYNEKYYLFHEEAIDNFERMYDQNQQRWDVEEDVFHDTLIKYEDFVVEIANLLHHLGYSSTLECSLLVSYLIESGALSKDYSFKGDAPDTKKEISCRLGTSIVKGEGCCRNYASLLTYIFEVLHLPTDYFYCYQGYFRRGLNRPANHVINLISHGENIYGIDLYNNNHLYHFTKPLVMREVSTTSNRSLLYKPYYEITMGKADLDSIKKRIKRFQDYSERRTINPFEYEDEIRFDAKRKIQDESSKLYQFHERTKQLKKDIASDIFRVYK